MQRVVSVLVLTIIAILAVSTPARAEDKAKIRVLLLTGDDVGAHPWKEIAAATADALKAVGRFDVTVSEDLKVLDSADTLKGYDVLVLTRYNRAGLPVSDQAKANVMQFVADGKGFFVQHLASASFPKWDEFNKLCGRYWVMGKSGHGPRSVFESKIIDKDHPITKGLKDFKTDDELYAKLLGDEKINVLVETYSDWSKKTEPLVFWKAHGKGRVVHNAYGHDGKALSTPEVRTIIARGVEWAATGKVAAE